MLTGGTQFVQHAARNERGGDDLRRRVIELLAGVKTEVLEDTDVLEASIFLQVLDALRAKREILLDLAVVGVPQLAVVAGVFDDDFVRANRLHGVVEAVARAAGIAFDVIDAAWDGRRRAPTRDCRSPWAST